MEGFIMPVQCIPTQVHAVMTMDVSNLSVRMVQSGECETAFSLPTDETILTFNYTAILQDEEAPVLIVDAPAEGLVVPEPVVEVSGLSYDDSMATPTVTVNGVEVAVDEATGAFATTVALARSEHVVTITSADPVGNSTSEQRTVIVDEVPPVLDWIEPENGATLYSQYLTVSGTATDNISVPSVFVNGKRMVVDPVTGAFSKEIIVLPGLNTLTVAADDGANEVSESRVVNFIVPWFMLEVIEPGDGAVTNQASIGVFGFAADETGVPPVTTINDVPVDLDPDNYTFNYDVPLDPGENLVTVVADNGLKTVLTEEFTVTSDTVPPVLEVTCPEEGALVNETEILVCGTATDALGIPTVEVNGVDVEVDPVDGTFETLVTLVPHDNVITITATDVANQTFETRTVILDNSPPILLVLFPQDGQTTTDESVYLIGFALDDILEPPNVSLNGVPIPVDPMFFFLFSLIDLEIGANEMVVTCDDGINVVEDTRTVYREEER